MYFKFIIIILVLPLKLVQGDDSNERDKDLVLFNNFWNVNDKVNKSGIDGINKVDNGLNITGALKWDTIIDMVSDLFDFEDQSTNETTVAESRGKKGGGKGKEKGFMEKILPMMVIPFMVSTSFIPMMLISLIGMLFKSAIIGKIGIILMLINMFRSRSNGGGVYSHNVHMQKDLAMEHYGYQGDEEYGAYINRKRRRKRRV